MKQHLIALDTTAPNHLTPAEVTVLSDEAFEVSEKGDVITRRDRFVSTDRALRLLFRVASRVYELGYNLPVHEAGWDQFTRTLKVRNRLTHPKSAADLIVSDENLASAHSAQAWFHRVSLEFVQRLMSG